MAYYTPDSEEFCIGLECQVKYIDGWKDRKIRHGEDLCEIVSRYTTDKESVEVKVLDREDIESCGLVLEKEGRFSLKINENLIYIIFIISDELFIFKKEKTRPNSISSWDINTVFAGKIKNKKEFQKLLAQLNI